MKRTSWNKGLHVYFRKIGIIYVEDNCICVICGKSFHMKPCAKRRGRGKCCSNICRHKWKSQLMKGMKNKKYGQPLNKNPNWQGGISRLPYHISFNEELKEKIRKRDNYECQICNMTEEEHIIVLGRKLAVHHLDYNKENCAEGNLKSLCCQCNSRVNFNREYWKQYFKEVMPNALTR